MPESKGKVESFEELRIWQKARLLAGQVYRDFQEGTAGCRDFGFRRQIQDAGISIMNNIAEGFERRTDADFARFLDIAKGSCGEVRSMYYAAEDLRYVSPEIASARRSLPKEISRGTAKLAVHLRSH